MKHPELQLLEDLLRFFHVACAKRFEALPQEERPTQLAAIDIAAANALIKHQHLPVEAIQKQFPDAVRPSAEILKVTESLDHPWIAFTPPGAAPSAAVAEDKSRAGGPHF